VSAHPQMPHVGAADGATTGGCPYGLAWTITCRGRPLCLPIHKCPTRAPPTGQPQGVAPTVCHCIAPSGRGGPLCPPIHKCPTRALPTGQPQGVAPTVCREPSPVGADPVSAHLRTPFTRALPTGQPQGVAPTVCREPSPVGADPVSAHLRTPFTRALPTGQPQGVAPTVWHEPSSVGADLRVCPSTNPIHAGAADRATTGGCPYGLP
jgi:hypothetical protein